MIAPEFSRPIALDTLGEAPRKVAIEAGDAERAALAQRFGLLAIASLSAEAELHRDGDVITAKGRVRGEVTQSCVASGAPVPARVDEPFELAFRPEPAGAMSEEEVELGESEMDVVFYTGGAVDLGEAVAETLSLALDPYPRAPDADAALNAAGVKNEDEAGPFGALVGLRDRLSGPDRAS